MYFVEWRGWYDSYALLLCDYLCSALPQLTSPGSPSVSLCKEAVTRLTGHLLGRLGQDPGNTEVTTAAILALAGGEILSQEKRARHADILRGESPEHVVTRDAASVTGPGLTQEDTRLPQTDLSAGLLECLTQDKDAGILNIPEVMTSLNTGPGLVTLLLAQTNLSKFVTSWRHVVAGADLDIPPLHPDDVKTLASEVSLARKLINLPLFGGISPAEMTPLSGVTFGCLLASMSALQIPMADDSSSGLVMDTIAIMDMVTDIARVSTRLGASTAMNLTAFSAWLIISGLKNQLASATSGAMSCSPLTVSLATHCLACLRSLNSDLGNDKDMDCSPATLDLSGQFSGLARLKLVFGSAPVLQLLLQLASHLYQAAVISSCCSLDYIPETVFDAVESQASETSAVDESELVLGPWMTQLLAPVTSGQPGSVSGAKGRPDTASPMTGAYLSLASTILSWLSVTLASAHPYLKVYTTTSLSPDLIHCLSYLLREANSEAVNSVAAWPEFSSALSSFSHHLISCPLPDPLVSLLLTDLSLSPTASASTPWPLSASRRSLSILAQILLTRQATDSTVFAQYVTIWQRAMSTMTLTAKASPSPGNDLSLCNIHLLLLTFHSLQLMQKKAVLLAVATNLREVCTSLPKSPGSHTCLMLGKLALILDYLIRHLYEPPASLLPQIKMSLFSVGLSEEQENSCPGEERMYYLLYPSNSNSLHPLEVPKLDGLAVSFLLSTPDAIDYPGLYTSLIASLESADTEDREGGSLQLLKCVETSSVPATSGPRPQRPREPRHGHGR